MSEIKEKIKERMKTRIVDVRSEDKCEREGGEWDEEWGVCEVKAKRMKDFLVEQPYYESYEEEEDFLTDYYNRMGRKGIRKVDYIGSEEEETKKLDEVIMDEFDRDLDDITVFEKGGKRFRVLWAWPKGYPAPPKG